MVVGVDGFSCCGNYTGIGAYVKYVINNLAEKNKDDTYLLYIFEGDAIDVKEFSPRIKVRQVPRYGLISPGFWLLFMSWYYLIKDKVQIFYASNYAPLFMNKNIKLLLCVYDFYVYISYSKSLNFMVRNAVRFLMAQSIQRANIILTISNAVKNEFYLFFPNYVNKVLVAYPPVIISRESTNSENDIKVKYALTGKIILTIGSIESRRNSLSVAKASKLLAERYSEKYTWVVVGRKSNEKKYCKEFEIAVESDKNLRYLNYVSKLDLIKLLESCDLFVSLSIYEGFGIPPIEALKKNKKVLVSDIPVFHETMGDNAFYVSPMSPKEIAASVESCLNKNIDLAKINLQNLSEEKTIQTFIKAINRIKDENMFS